MSKTLFENLLEQYKRANQGAKQKLAEKNGFGTKEEYLKYIQQMVDVGNVQNKPLKTKKKVAKKSTVHSIIILDASGSMEGGKYNNACKGILEEFETLKNNKDATFTFTLVEFVQSNNIKTPFTLFASIPEFKFNGAKGGNTPLYKTVYDTIQRVDKIVPDGEKVLVKVFTDGLNNHAYEYRALCAQLIKEVEEDNFTVTFVATEQDMKHIVRDLSLEESNTLAVTDDALGFKTAFVKSLVSTQTYASKVSRGLDVSKNFYGKQIGKL